MDQVQEIKQKIDIVELISAHTPLKKAGRNYKGLCPFHGEKTPSFMVNPELQIFKCFGCQVGGDAFTFLQKIEGMDFYESLQTLAKKAGVTLVSYKPSQSEELRERLISANSLACEYYHYLLTKHDLGKKALAYLKSRKIASDLITTFKLGYAPEGWDYLTKFLRGKKKFDLADLQAAGLAIKNYDRFRNRVMFPLNNVRGQTVGFAGRVMPPSTDAKYINTSETEIYHKSELLYGLDITRGEIKKVGFAVIVEGEIDCIASYQAGVKNVVAIKGSALTVRQVEMIRRLCETVVLALDSDKAGDAAARRGIEIADKAGLNIKVVTLAAAKDPGEYAIEDPKGWHEAVKKAIPIYDFYIKSAVERFGLEAAGKRKIGQELVPIISNIEDGIVKAHYIKLLAKTLEVDESDIRSQLAKTPNPLPADASHQAMQAGKSNILEEYMVELALKGNKIGELPELIDPFWSKVVEHLKKKKIAELPPELKARTEELLLHETEFDIKEWDKTITRWKQTDARGRLKQTSDPKTIRDLTRILG